MYFQLEIKKPGIRPTFFFVTANVGQAGNSLGASRRKTQRAGQ